MSDVIDQLISQYRKTPRQINNGDCEQFASRLLKAMEKDHGIKGNIVYATDFFKKDPKRPYMRPSEFDQKKMKAHWPDCVPLHGTTWEQMSVVADSYGHAWYTLNKMHYDAECPKGVKNFFALPFYERLADYVRKRYK